MRSGAAAPDLIVSGTKGGEFECFPTSAHGTLRLLDQEESDHLSTYAGRIEITSSPIWFFYSNVRYQT